VLPQTAGFFKLAGINVNLRNLTIDDVRVSTESSNEHDCAGEFPCESIDYGNQYGDYEGLVSFAGHSHPIWTDSRRNTEQAGDPDCGFGLGLMEEVFSARVEQ